jgi:RNA polymerase sigma-70 factor (ECF subfamily)
MEALGRLDPDERHVVVLHYMADLDTAEIARELALPESTVTSRLSRGREQLGSLLGRREESDHV